jgi:dihydrofolate reductase
MGPILTQTVALGSPIGDQTAADAYLAAARQRCHRKAAWSVRARLRRRRWEGGTTFTFVPDGIESAVEQARATAGVKNVNIAGGGETIRQSLETGLLDELEIHLAPLLLGDGVRLFGDVDQDKVELDIKRVVDSPRMTHLLYRILK